VNGSSKSPILALAGFLSISGLLRAQPATRLCRSVAEPGSTSAPASPEHVGDFTERRERAQALGRQLLVDLTNGNLAAGAQLFFRRPGDTMALQSALDRLTAARNALGAVVSFAPLASAGGLLTLEGFADRSCGCIERVVGTANAHANFGVRFATAGAGSLQIHAHLGVDSDSIVMAAFVLDPSDQASKLVTALDPHALADQRCTPSVGGTAYSRRRSAAKNFASGSVFNTSAERSHARRACSTP